MLNKNKKTIISVFLAAFAIFFGIYFVIVRSHQPSGNPASQLTASLSSSLASLTIPTEFQAQQDTISLTWTDDNEGENLIIQSDRKYYSGQDSSDVYFSLTNASDKEQKTDVIFWFENGDKYLAGAEKINTDGNPNNPARLANESVAGKQIPISNKIPNFNFPIRKDTKGHNSGRTFNDTIASGQTNFYKAVIRYPSNSQGEFFIEAIGRGSALAAVEGARPELVEGYGFLTGRSRLGLLKKIML